MTDDAIPAGMIDARAREVLLENMLAKPWGGAAGGDFWKFALVTTDEAIAAMLAYAKEATPAASSDELDGAREALERIARPKFGLQGIQEDHGHDTNAYNYRAMEYYKALAHGYEQDARAALAASRPTDAGAIDPELVERVRYAVEHPDAKGFALAKAGMTRHDFRRILNVLATPKPPVDEAMRERCAKVADAVAAAEEEAGEGGGREWSCALHIAKAIRNLTGDGAGA